MTNTPVSLQHYFLDEESKKIVTHFEDAFVMHQNVQDVFDRILRVITHPGEKTLVGVVGPSGVGKTALMQQIYKHLKALSQFDPNWHEGRIACGKMTLSLQGNRVFDWTYFMTDCLNLFQSL